MLGIVDSFILGHMGKSAQEVPELLGFPHTFGAPSGESMHRRTASICRNVLEVLYHYAKFGGFGLRTPPGKLKMLNLCWSVRHVG